MLFLIGLLLRLVPVLLSYNLGIGLDDMFQYDMLARSLASGNGYRWYAQDDLYLVQPYVQFDLSIIDYQPRGVPTSFRPPLYPMFLAIIYFFTGSGSHRFFIVRIVQAVIGAMLVPMTYLLGKKFSRENGKVARLSAWIIAFYPILVIYPLALATENIFFFLVLGSLLALLHAIETRRTMDYVLAGFSLGLMALTRSISLSGAGLVIIWMWFFIRDKKAAIILFTIITIMTVPWMIRNSRLHGRLMGIESTLGYNLYIGYHPKSTGTFEYGISTDLIPILDDSVRDRIGMEKALQFIKDDPDRIPYLMIRRLGYFFGLERRALTYFYSNNFFGYITPPLLITFTVILLLPFVLISTSAMYGIALTHWTPQSAVLPFFIIGYLTPHVFIMAEDRFHLAIVPILVILAATSWTGSFSGLKERWKTHSGQCAILIATIATILLIVNWGFELASDSGKLTQLIGPNGNITFFPY